MQIHKPPVFLTVKRIGEAAEKVGCQIKPFLRLVSIYSKRAFGSDSERE